MNCMPHTRARWTPWSVGIMVVGFIVAWPLGLAVLAYILWGDNMRTAIDEMKYKWGASRAGNGSNSGNIAFDEYREQELKRLEEERRKLDAMREEFDRFMHELRRAKDKDEFDRFMSQRGKRDDSEKGFGGAAPSGSPA